MVVLRYIRYPVAVVASKEYLDASCCGMAEIETSLIPAFKVSFGVTRCETAEYVSCALLVISKDRPPSDLIWKTLIDDFDDKVYKRSLVSSTTICSMYS